MDADDRLMGQGRRKSRGLRFAEGREWRSGKRRVQRSDHIARGLAVPDQDQPHGR